MGRAEGIKEGIEEGKEEQTEITAALVQDKERTRCPDQRHRDEAEVIEEGIGKKTSGEASNASEEEEKR